MLFTNVTELDLPNKLTPWTTNAIICSICDPLVWSRTLQATINIGEHYPHYFRPVVTELDLRLTNHERYRSVCYDSESSDPIHPVSRDKRIWWWFPSVIWHYSLPHVALFLQWRDERMIRSSALEENGSYAYLSWLVATCHSFRLVVHALMSLILIIIPRQSCACQNGPDPGRVNSLISNEVWRTIEFSR